MKKEENWNNIGHGYRNSGVDQALETGKQCTSTNTKWTYSNK